MRQNRLLGRQSVEESSVLETDLKMENALSRGFSPWHEPADSGGRILSTSFQNSCERRSKGPQTVVAILAYYGQVNGYLRRDGALRLPGWIVYFSGRKIAESIDDTSTAGSLAQ